MHNAQRNLRFAFQYKQVFVVEHRIYSDVRERCGRQFVCGDTNLSKVRLQRIDAPNVIRMYVRQENTTERSTRSEQLVDSGCERVLFVLIW
jgi:hypothetical protein